MTLKSVVYLTIYILLFALLVFVGMDLRDAIHKARFTQHIEPKIIYGTVEELK